MSGAPIALVDAQRQIVVVRANGRQVPLTAPPRSALLWGTWGSPPSESAAWSWPTWSPDGRTMACFRTSGDERGTHAMLLDVGGASDTELVSLGRRLPIYLHWAPDGQALAVLSQREDKLVLSVARPEQVGREALLAEASPLFFTWAGPSRVAAYLGSGATPGGRMSLLDAGGIGHETVLPGTPGNFCAPVWVPDGSDGRVVYVAHEEGRTHVVRARPDSAETDHLETVDGLVALVPSPDGRRIARGVAPDGDATPYRDLAILDPITGEVRPLAVDPCLAFLWSPAGDALVVARVDTARNLLTWSRIDLEDGSSAPLIDLYPTRDLGFYLRFFEQYGPSHRVVDPTGSHLLLAGTVPGRDTGDSPRVWRVGLKDGAVDEISEGLFAVYGPAAP